MFTFTYHSFNQERFLGILETGLLHWSVVTVVQIAIVSCHLACGGIAGKKLGAY